MVRSTFSAAAVVVWVEGTELSPGEPVVLPRKADIERSGELNTLVRSANKARSGLLLSVEVARGLWSKPGSATAPAGEEKDVFTAWSVSVDESCGRDW